MTAVMIESKNVGQSGWVKIHTYHGSIKVSNMKLNDLVKLEFLTKEIKTFMIIGDTDLSIPEGAIRVRASHEKASGSLVSVDIR